MSQCLLHTVIVKLIPVLCTPSLSVYLSNLSVCPSLSLSVCLLPQDEHQPWYDEDTPCVHSGFYWPPEASSNAYVPNGKPPVARAYPTPPSHSPSPAPGYYQQQQQPYEHQYESITHDSIPYPYHHPLDDKRTGYDPAQLTAMDRVLEYNEQKILSQHRLERCHFMLCYRYMCFACIL